ncbi:hypothetical protein yc1106_02395 [Curvularia clavata]|uniref:AB hydrolase-1 domain-containing protein n=1 Tax=Curvularia clavata TaxID=95742 RepID=A0A9Q8Z395_CURCL|nr:hypothetical protein yc1106_02395 [Curvularia clavata]
MISVLFIVGALRLASQYRFNNPGSVVHTILPSGTKISTNYYCTAVPSVNSTSLPTIWFESSAAHGVTDFLGVQTFLAESHGRNSCSYDPPNFGWSSRWPASEKLDLNAVFDPLLAAIGRQGEKKVLAGWGGGAENVLKHARQNPTTVEGVVFLDASPNGIEWLDRKRALNLTMKETIDFAKTDMRGRVTLAQIILTLGIPWGLLPIFVPANETGYFDQAEYPRHHAQSLKEDMWAMQYYQLVDQSSSPFGVKLEDLQLPNDISVYGIATYNSGSDTASDQFYRYEKVQLANSVSAGNITKPFVWCEEADFLGYDPTLWSMHRFLKQSLFGVKNEQLWRET